MPIPPHEIDWSLTTFDGVRREQLRRNLRLTVQQRLEAVEDMAAFARDFHAALKPAAGIKTSNPPSVCEPRSGYSNKSE